MGCLLETGCCGSSLKKSTLIWGYINLVVAILGFIGSVYLLATFKKNPHGIPYGDLDDGRYIVYSDEEDSYVQNLKGHPLADLIGSTVFLLICIMFIMGAELGKPCLMLPWIICGFLEFICMGILFLAANFIFFQNLHINNIVPLLIVYLFTALCFYIWLIVVSYFAELRREERTRSSAYPAPSEL